MNANRNALALRRRSIRTLTASELSIAHGGAPATTKKPPPTSGPCQTRTVQPTKK
jgi:hypothetical protein